MELVLSFKIIESNELAQQLENAFSLGYPLQLKFDSLIDYEKCIETIAESLSKNSSKVVSLKGPLVPSKSNTLFEDTVLIASRLEDFFDVNLKFISTFYSNSYKHIEELIDFYGDTRIHVEGLKCDPISTMTLIAESNIINKFKRVTGLTYNVNSLAGAWLTPEIILALSDCIFEFNYKPYLRTSMISKFRLLDSTLIYLLRNQCPNAVFTVEFVPVNYIDNLPEVKLALSSFFNGYSPYQSIETKPILDSLFAICNRSA